MENEIDSEIKQSENDNLNLQKQELINYLNSEIINLENEIQRPGWSRWAIVGGLSTLVWLLLNYLSNNSFSFSNISLFILLIFIIEFIYSRLSTLFVQENRVKNRFLPADLFSRNILPMILSLTQLIAMVIISFTIPSSNGQFGVIFSRIYFIFLSFCALLAMVFVGYKYPIPTHISKKRRKIVIGLIDLTFFSIILWQYTYVLLSYYSVNVTDIRIALIISAIYYLLSTLLRSKRGTFTLNSLILTRRELALGQIDLETAVSSTDIALSGHRIIDIFEEYISDLISLYREASSEMDKILVQFSILEKLYSKSEQPPLEEKLSQEEALYESIDKKMDRTEIITQQLIPQAFRPVHTRIRWIDSVAESSDIIEYINEKLMPLEDELQKKYSELREKLRIIRNLSKDID
ncbi:hypothetical protein ACFLYN_04035 [Chloroflexota bacterium]